MRDSIDLWANIKELIIFGYGRQARKIVKVLNRDFNIIAVVDNNKAGITIGENNKEVILSFEESKKILSNHKIIITVRGSDYEQIKKQLKKLNLEEDVDFMQHEKFITEWYRKFKNQINMLKTDLFVTSFCTLKCEKCTTFVPYWKENRNMDIGILKASVDKYFEYVDFLCSMDIVGGEPFLFDKLTELLYYIKSNYSDRIGYLGVITNGTLIPSEKVLKFLHDYNVGISISDYSHSLDLNYKIEILCDVLEKSEIRYNRNRNLIWKDMGFPQNKYYYIGEKAKEHRKKCNNTCHVIYDNKFFFCISSLTAYLGKLAPLFEDDYLDLESSDTREKIQYYSLGYFNKPYRGFCSACGGFGEDNPSNVQATLQIKSEEDE